MINNIKKIRLGRNVTIGMPAYGNYQTTKHALDAIFFSAEGDFELILVDDCSPDSTLSLFLDTKKKYPYTKVLSFDRNLEYSGSLNAILSHATGEWILFVSNDIFITPGYLREIFRIAKLNHEFGIVRGVSNLVDNNGLNTHNIAIPGNIENMEKLSSFSESIAEEFGGQYLIDRFLTGDAFLISRKVIEKIGTLDPHFYGYFADHDFGIRTRIAGYKLVLARGAFAMHMQSANFEYLPEAERQVKLHLRWMRVFENWARFKLKYGLPVDQPYTSINDIPWDILSSAEFDIAKYYCPSANYSRFILENI
jgi:GT2 family glycosyltransferase